MEKRKLGKSGIEASIIGLGCNNFGAMPVDASRRVIDRSEPVGQSASTSSTILACFKSSVSRPSVNQP